MPEFLVHRLVASEFKEVRNWYAKHSPWAAENFVQRFDTALNACDVTLPRNLRGEAIFDGCAWRDSLMF